MVLRGKNILIISPEPWDHIFVSKHHYAVYLARMGNHVFFAGPPSSEMSVASTEFQNLYLLRYDGFMFGMRYLPKSLRKFLLRAKYEQIERICGIHFDIIWSFDNSVFYDFDALPEYLTKITHIVDLNQDFQTEKSARTANYCFCTSELIKRRLLKFNPNVSKINHGFHSERQESYAVPRKLGKPAAVYAGNLALPYIDWLALREVVKGNPDVDFLFIGPNANGSPDDKLMATAKKDTMQSPNSKVLGRVPPDALQAYYQSADILLIAYQEAFHDEQANPHKMMEYLGSGKMIVATLTGEYAVLMEKDLILMSGRNAEYPSLFLRALKELLHWNSMTLQQARKAIAMANTYQRQIEKIERIIS